MNIPVARAQLCRISFTMVAGVHRTAAALRRFGGALGLCVALCAAPVEAQAPGDLRIALVIGNASYAGTAALANPGNDARAMTETLKALGFQVTQVQDASLAQMTQAIAQVRDQLRGRQGIGVLYYAGHGVQVDFRNYMLPVDVKLTTNLDVTSAGVDVGSVIDAFRAAGNRMNIVVLDACRDNPFGRGSVKGLAPLDAPSGTFLAYATAPGNVAEDGDTGSGNGLYTGYLVKELQKPSARIEDVFKRVRLQVRQQSHGRQIPWESTSLEEDFYFNDGQKFTFRSADFERIAQSARLKQEELDAAAAAAREAERLKQLSKEKAREEAFRAERNEWERIRDSRNVEDFYAFLKKHPSGYVSEEAMARLEVLQRAQVQAQRAKDAPAVLAPGAQRLYVGDVFEFDLVDGFTKAGRRVVNRVTKVDGDVVEVNGGAMLLTQTGMVRKNQFGTHEPGILSIPAELAVGKRWRTAYQTRRPDGMRETSFWDLKVAALEDVTVPAGTFRAYRIEGTGEARSETGVITFLTGTSWVDPATMTVLRADRLFRSNGKITEWFSLVSVRRQFVPRPS